MQLVEEGVDLFKFVAHGRTNVPALAHDAKTLEERVWVIVRYWILFDAIMRKIRLGIWTRRFCAFEQCPPFFCDADVEVFVVGLYVDL